MPPCEQWLNNEKIAVSQRNCMYAQALRADAHGPKMKSSINAKGQVTIPIAIREHLCLKPGDRVKFFVHPNGSVVLWPKIPVSQLRGMVKAGKRPATIEEMDAAIAAGAADVPLPDGG
jgi:antitoxin PrlF